MIRKRSEVAGAQPASAGAQPPQDASPPGNAPKVDAAPERAAPSTTQARPADAPTPPPEPRQTSDQPKELVVEGDEVTMCYGVDKYSPVDYNTFEHGPFFAKVKVRAGETLADAGARAWNVCMSLAKGSYPGKAQEYLKNLFALGAEIASFKSHLK